MTPPPQELPVPGRRFMSRRFTRRWLTALLRLDVRDVGPRRVNRAVNNVTSLVHAIFQRAEIGRAEDRPIEVELDEAGRRDLLIQHAVRIDQKSAFFVRHARGYVVGHHVGQGYVWQQKEFAEIARVQSEREEEAARRAERVLICDTDRSM